MVILERLGDGGRKKLTDVNMCQGSKKRKDMTKYKT